MYTISGNNIQAIESLRVDRLLDAEPTQPEGHCSHQKLVYEDITCITLRELALGGNKIRQNSLQKRTAGNAVYNENRAGNSLDWELYLLFFKSGKLHRNVHEKSR